MTIEVVAPAKVNLALHITGLRQDGYHLLDSLVSFPDVGDRLTVSKSDIRSLQVSGPFADDVPIDENNLILRAAALLGVNGRFELEKNLPVAAGIGGGSSDAAAAIRALTTLYNIPVPSDAELMSLGADVPACMHRGVIRMSGIGERLQVVESSRLGIPMVLVNPGIALSTPQVFAALKHKENAPISNAMPMTNSNAFIPWLSSQRNDLEAPAKEICPEIGEILDALSVQHGCALARMSGSGATCFGLFPDERDAARAANKIQSIHPNWWVAAADIN